MRRLLVCALVAFVAGSAVAVAAPSAWRVVARGTGSGEFAIANASASVDKPGAVAFRVLGGASPDVTWALSCSGSVKNAKANRVYPLTAIVSDDCHVTALASGEGKTTVQILARRR